MSTPADPFADEAPSTPGTAARDCVLIVDDSADDRFSYCRLLLRNSGFSVFAEAGTGAQGLALAQSLSPVCVLLDYHLPDMTGLEVLDELRRRHRDLPVIMLTGIEDTAVSVEALRRGADDYQVKGKISGDSLPRAILNAIQQRALQAEIVAKQQRLELFYELVNHTSEMLFMLRLSDQKLIEINASALHQLGYQRGEASHPGFFAGRLSEDGRARWLAFTTGADRDLYCDTELVGRAGHELPIDLSAHRLRTDADEYAVIVARDITKRRALEAHLRRIGLVDGLTGLNNRRAFDQHLEAEWARAGRDGAPLALLMIDVDHFKLFNDSAGHLRGDDCLRLVAGVIGRTLRYPTDFAARYGGEEFAVILHGDLDAAADAGAAIIEAMTLAAFEHPGRPCGEHVSVSIGAACATGQSGSAEDLINRADRALYRAKRGGRNRLVRDGAPGTA